MKKVLILLGVMIFSIFALHNAISYNFEYVNVTSKVNITNAYPEITAISVDQSILLNAGTTKNVTCNVTVQDYNNYTDIDFVNATFWDSVTVNQADANENNTHYTDTNCSQTGNDGTYTANYSCKFEVWYFANASNWTCFVYVEDKYNFSDNASVNTTIQAYYAINVTPTIDFGEMAVGDTKNNKTANVTSFGNMPINVSVDGYGVTDSDGLAMDCAIRNISISNLRYNINGTIWGNAINLTDTPANISGLTVPKRTGVMIWNTTYWDLYIPPSENPFGVCNGTVVFTAQES